YRLTDSEIDRYRSLAQNAGEVIGQVAHSLTPGLSEREIARRANAALASVGAHPVVTLVAADDRMKRFRHPVPTDLAWKKSVMIVVCARRGGLIVSLSRIVCAGNIPEELAERTRLTAFVNAQLLAATVPGATSRELFAIVARAYCEAGF